MFVNNVIRPALHVQDNYHINAQAAKEYINSEIISANKLVLQIILKVSNIYALHAI